MNSHVLLLLFYDIRATILLDSAYALAHVENKINKGICMLKIIDTDVQRLIQGLPFVTDKEVAEFEQFDPHIRETLSHIALVQPTNDEECQALIIGDVTTPHDLLQTLSSVGKIELPFSVTSPTEGEILYTAIFFRWCDFLNSIGTGYRPERELHFAE